MVTLKTLVSSVHVTNFSIISCHKISEIVLKLSPEIKMPMLQHRAPKLLSFISCLPKQNKITLSPTITTDTEHLVPYLVIRLSSYH